MSQPAPPKVQDPKPGVEISSSKGLRAILPGPGPPNAAPRSKEIGPQVLNELAKSKATGRQTRWGMNIFKDWLSSKGKNIQFEWMQEDQLASLLREFYGSVRNANGDRYSRSAMTGLRAAIQRHLRLPPYERNINIVEDPKYYSANQVFKQSRVEGKKIVTHKNPIAPEDLKLIRESFDVDNPEGLQHKVYFDVMYFFSCRGREGFRSLTKYSFIIEEDERGKVHAKIRLSEVEKKKQGISCNDKEMKRRMYATGNHLCPVANLKKYIGLLHPKCEALFQRPNPKFEVSRVWYDPAALGHNTLNSIFKTICEKAGIRQSYTHSCIRAARESEHMRTSSCNDCVKKSSSRSQQQLSDEMLACGQDNTAHKTTTEELSCNHARIQLANILLSHCDLSGSKDEEPEMSHAMLQLKLIEKETRIRELEIRVTDLEAEVAELEGLLEEDELMKRKKNAINPGKAKKASKIASANESRNLSSKNSQSKSPTPVEDNLDALADKIWERLADRFPQKSSDNQTTVSQPKPNGDQTTINMTHSSASSVHVGHSGLDAISTILTKQDSETNSSQREVSFENSPSIPLNLECESGAVSVNIKPLPNLNNVTSSSADVESLLIEVDEIKEEDETAVESNDNWMPGEEDICEPPTAKKMRGSSPIIITPQSQSVRTGSEQAIRNQAAGNRTITVCASENDSLTSISQQTKGKKFDISRSKCLKRFPSALTLHSHHGKEDVCVLCGEEFDRPNQLIDHIMDAHT